jgi:hypothetical protein
MTQMTQKLSDLESAIDAVARELTRVDHDPQFTSRIVAALPERVTWFGWLTHSWAPRLAMIAIVATAAVVWNSRRATEVTVSPLPAASVAPAVEFVTAVRSANPERLTPVRTTPLEPVVPMEHLEAFQGLPSVEAPGVLALTDLTPAELPAQGSIDLAPLVIAELALTAESFPERDEE